MNTELLTAKGAVGGPGIDYSLGLANVDAKTGFHYGVISQHECLQAWADSSEPNYGTPDCAECPVCETYFDTPPGTEWGDRIECAKCGETFDVELPEDAEALDFDLNDGEYVAWAGGDGDIMILASPYYTYAHFCSPCAPGAGYLMSPFKIPKDYKDTAHTLTEISPDTESDLYKTLAEAAGFPKCFCFGHDWFDDGKAPYRVFNVQTGEEVKPNVL